jgi:outer membrane protein OmpA-like peptidoglycan-associated protein
LSVSWEGVGSAEPVIIEGVEDKELSRRVEIIVLAA